MTDVQWGQTRTHASWNIQRPSQDWRGIRKSFCGRRLDIETLRDDRPSNEATCESCYRIGGPR